MSFSVLGAYVINLKRKPERYRLFEETFRNVGIRYERQPACDGREIDIGPFIENLNPWFKVFGSEAAIRGTIGCKRSHEILWRNISQLPDGWYAVFEDDARPIPRRGKVALADVMASAPLDADFVWLNEYDSVSSFHLRTRAQQILNRVFGPVKFGSRTIDLADRISYSLKAFKFRRWYPIGSKTTEAYAIRPRFAGKLADYTETWTDSIDAQIRSGAEHLDCKIYVVRPPLFRQDETLASDIQIPNGQSALCD